MPTNQTKLIISLIDRFTGPSKRIAAASNKLTRASLANARQLNAMRSRMIGAAGAGYVLARAIASPIKAAIEFESAMADVRKVVDFDSPDGFANLSKDIIKMSLNTPIAAEGIAAIVAAAGQAGMKGDELLAFAEMAAKVGVAFDMSAGQTGTALAKIKTQLGLNVAGTGELADAMNHLSNTSASTAPDLIDYMKRVASVGEQYGFTAVQTAAIGSAMIAAGAESNVAATSFRNVGRALVKGGSATKKQMRAFKLLGISAKETAKSMQKDAVGTLQVVIAKLRALPAHLRSAAISDLFGEEARAIAPLIKRADLLAKTLKEVADKTKFLGSTQKEYAVRATWSTRPLPIS